MTDLTTDMRKKLTAEIRQIIKGQREQVRWLEREMDRIRPNWRSWLKPDDPRYDQTEYPHHHIGAD